MVFFYLGFFRYFYVVLLEVVYFYLVLKGLCSDYYIFRDFFRVLKVVVW